MISSASIPLLVPCSVSPSPCQDPSKDEQSSQQVVVSQVDDHMNFCLFPDFVGVGSKVISSAPPVVSIPNQVVHMYWLNYDFTMHLICHRPMFHYHLGCPAQHSGILDASGDVFTVVENVTI